MKMKLIALIALFTIVALTETLSITSTEWISFKSTYNKQYANKMEEEKRLHIFAKNVEEINEHNKKYESGLSTFERGINHLTDMTPEEIRKNMMGYREPENPTERNGKLHVPDKTKSLPDHVNWLDFKGVVTRVKDQGQCGSCWAFSSTGGIEGQFRLRYNDSIPISLSEQNLIDCSKKNNGCDGGIMELAYDYVIANNGIDLEVGYRYAGIDQFCEYDPRYKGAFVLDYKFIKNGSESDLQDAVANIGPIPIAFDANHPSFFSYKSGVWDDSHCKTDAFSHAVLIVGYGTTKSGVDYWLVKNSWGTGWGMVGYFAMPRNKNNQCGVAGHALYPIVK